MPRRVTRRIKSQPREQSVANWGLFRKSLVKLARNSRPHTEDRHRSVAAYAIETKTPVHLAEQRHFRNQNFVVTDWSWVWAHKDRLCHLDDSSGNCPSRNKRSEFPFRYDTRCKRFHLRRRR